MDRQLYNALMHLRKKFGDGIANTLIKGASGSFAVKVFGTGISFFVTLFLTRYLGADNFGIYVYAITWINFLALFGKLGFDSSAVRYVASYKAKEEWGLLRGFIRRSRQVTTGISLLISIAGLCYFIFVEVDESPVFITTFLTAFLLLPIYVTLATQSSLLQGLKRVVLAHTPNMVLRPIFMLAALWLASSVMGMKLHANNAMEIELAVTMMALMVTFIYIYKSMPEKVGSAEIKFQTKEWIAVSLPLFLHSGFAMALNNIDIIMVGALLGTKESGFYAVAAKTSQLVAFGLVAVNAIAAPLISQLSAEGRKEELQKMISLAALGSMFVATPVIILFLVAGEFVLSLFGPEFIVGNVALIVLAIGQLINAFAGSVGFLLTMTGNEKIAARTLGISVVVNITLNAIAIPLFGIVGAAIATAVTTIGWNVALVIYAKRRLQIDPTILPLLKRL